MKYTFTFRKRFAEEFDNLDKSQEDAILGFLVIYEDHGLVNLSKYQGKISHSWASKGIPKVDFRYAKKNSLWHVHVGLPYYRKSSKGDYLTSDVVLHFQWIDKGTHIQIVKLTPHYHPNRRFQLPDHTYLK